VLVSNTPPLRCHSMQNIGNPMILDEYYIKIIKRIWWAFCFLKCPTILGVISLLSVIFEMKHEGYEWLKQFHLYLTFGPTRIFLHPRLFIY